MGAIFYVFHPGKPIQTFNIINLFSILIRNIAFDIAQVTDMKNQLVPSPGKLKSFLKETLSNFVKEQDFVLSVKGATNNRDEEIIEKIKTIFLE